MREDGTAGKEGLGSRPMSAETAIVGERVELQLFTTLECNLSCRYCIEEEGDIRGSWAEVSYSLDALERFVKDQLQDREIIATFYGGEPLLNLGFVYAVIDRFPLWRFQLQTNGTLLNSLAGDYARRIDSYLVSLDGCRETTDRYRGEGTYETAIGNVSRLRDQCEAYFTARCTWASAAQKKSDFDCLLQTFDYVHFQFPHSGWVYSDEFMRNTRTILVELMRRFYEQRSLYRILPLMGFVRNALFPSRGRELYGGRTQCRVSSHLINVLPSGRIVACPDFAYAPSMRHGDIEDDWLMVNPLQRNDAFPCNRCDAYGLCRSNCVMGLHRAYVMGDAQYRQSVVEPTCELIRFLADLVSRRDALSWYCGLGLPERRELVGSPLYEYVEVAP